MDPQDDGLREWRRQAAGILSSESRSIAGRIVAPAARGPDSPGQESAEDRRAEPVPRRR